MGQPIVVPIARNVTRQCLITPAWFVQKEKDVVAEYHPHSASFELLINGENAFRAVHEAITDAKQSICIICWGFQPSMYFKRGNRTELMIGELLEQKGMEGVKVKVLSFVVDPLWLGIGVTGWAAGEANTPGRRAYALSDHPATASDDAYRYDQAWYLRYDEDQKIADAHGKRTLDATPRTRNLRFVGRGFGPIERYSIATNDHAEQQVSTLTTTMQALGPSHHQKMVLVDYEDPAHAIGFVMGHNMLDEYWDRSDHSYVRQSDPRRGRNGARPRQDFSSRVTGPLLGDLFHNFNAAWEKETDEKLPGAPFETYPVRTLGRSQPIMGQILRTQPQYGVEDIKAGYLQAVNNATQYIYIENQYFRWPVLAEKIKACADGQAAWGRTPETHGPLYLFVITNADKEGMGAGTVNTARMLDSLGRADALPAVSREVRVEDTRAELSRAQLETYQAYERRNQYQTGMMTARNAQTQAQYKKLAEQAGKEAEAAKAREQALKEKLATQQQASKDEAAIVPENLPNLKVQVCTLVSPDTPGRTVAGDETAAENRADRPLTRAERIAKAEADLKLAEKDVRRLQDQQYALDSQARQLMGVPNAAGELTKLYENLNRKLLPAREKRDQLKAKLTALQDGSNPVDWVDVYIHAKLMIIDDTFMTVGSANINSRSMETDSELNIIHERHTISAPARRELWGLHTKRRDGGSFSGEEAFDKGGMEKAYNNWAYVIDQNKKRRVNKLSPIASLVEFFSATKERTDKD